MDIFPGSEGKVLNEREGTRWRSGQLSGNLGGGNVGYLSCSRKGRNLL